MVSRMGQENAELRVVHKEELVKRINFPMRFDEVRGESIREPLDPSILKFVSDEAREKA